MQYPLVGVAERASAPETTTGLEVKPLMEKQSISSDMVRSTLDVVILSVLSAEASYGYAVSQKISLLSSGVYEVKETTLYAAIRRLEQKGFLESFAGTETAGRPRTYYRLTELGKRALIDQIASWKTASVAVNQILGA